MEDLWPSEFFGGHMEAAPVVILREQGALLGQKTNNILEGEVVSHADEYPSTGRGLATPLLDSATVPSNTDGSSVEREVETKQNDPLLYHSFYIKVPSLGNYRYRLFYVRHPVLLYPATIHRDSGKEVECRSEFEFKEALRSIFFEEETQRIIGTLLTQGMSPVAVTT